MSFSVSCRRCGIDLSTDRTLLQVSAGPGRAESLLAATREGAWTSTGRFQFDLGTRTVLVGSAIHRGAAGASRRWFPSCTFICSGGCTAMNKSHRLSSSPLALILALGLAVLGLSACGSDPAPPPTAPTPTQPEPEPEPEPDPDVLSPALSSIQRNVFSPTCVVCHGDSDAEAGLNLEEGTSFDSLVNATSTQVALDLVEPNDAENSYLIHKLEGRAGIEGDRMPPDDPLSSDDIDVIREWIDDGAEDN